jgi:tetratricopeptide (TPR) repeat protein
LNNLANVDLLQNRPEDAHHHFEKALELRRQLAERDAGKYLPDVARTLTELAFLDRNQNRIQESRARYQEALRVFVKLSQSDNRYAAPMARVEADLAELDRKARSN